MSAPLAQNRDVLAGVFFVAIGVGALLIAQKYPFGAIQEMGPGFFPRVLSVILIAFGVITIYRGLQLKETIKGGWGWIPLAVLALALVGFGWSMEKFGLVPSVVLLTFLSVVAGRNYRWREFLGLTVILCSLAVLIFIAGLGLPYPVFSFEIGG